MFRQRHIYCTLLLIPMLAQSSFAENPDLYCSPKRDNCKHVNTNRTPQNAASEQCLLCLHKKLEVLLENKIYDK